VKTECEHEGTIAQVKDCINLGGLPDSVDRNDRVLDNFDRLEAGQSLIIIDDYKLDWISTLLDEHRPDQFDRRFFHLHREAGRHEACIKKRSNIPAQPT